MPSVWRASSSGSWGVGGLVAAAFGIWAARLTKQGNEAAEADRVASAKARLGSIQPRPGIGRAMATPGSETVTLHISNPGAAAAMWHVLVTVGDGVYYKRTVV